MPINPEEKQELEAIRSSLHNMLQAVQTVVLKIERYLLRRDRRDPPEPEE